MNLPIGSAGGGDFTFGIGGGITGGIGGRGGLGGSNGSTFFSAQCFYNQDDPRIGSLGIGVGLNLPIIGGGNDDDKTPKIWGGSIIVP